MNEHKIVIPLIAIMCGAILATYAINVDEEAVGGIFKEKEWRIENWGVLGDLDQAYSTGNSSILGVWIVNHSENPEDWYPDINNTVGSTAINDSCTVYGYAQGSSFDLEVPHSTDLDLLIYVRANATNAADGTMFNDTWVMLNFTTGSGLGCTGGVNLTGFVTHNTTGDPAMYMLFVYNGTDLGIQDQNGINSAMTGTGFQISRDNRSYITSMQLQCYY